MSQTHIQIAHEASGIYNENYNVRTGCGHVCLVLFFAINTNKFSIMSKKVN